MELLDSYYFSDFSKDKISEVAEKLNKVFCKNISNETRDYLLSRGVSKEDIVKYEWGTCVDVSIKNHSYILPIFKKSDLVKDDGSTAMIGMPIYPIRHAEGYIVGFQARSLETKKYYTMPLNSIQPNIYGMHLYGPGKKQIAFITEGWFDFFSVSKSIPINVPIISCLTANVRNNYLTYLSRWFSRLVFLFDIGYWDTDAGKIVKQRIVSSGISYDIIDFPKIPNIKDWSEFYQTYGEAKTASLLLKMIPELESIL